MKTEQEIEEKLKRTEQENKRLLETINAKPLETVDMDRAFEIEKLKDQPQAKEQECEELKDKNQYLINTCCHFKNEIKKYKKAVHKYKVVLQDKIKRLHLSLREFLKEINSVPVKIACKGENFKNALNNFNNGIQVINKVQAFSFGKNYGFWIGLLTGLGIPYQKVTPLKWQSALNLKSRGLEYKQKKNVLKGHAQRLFPELNPTLETCDALLIGEYGRQTIIKEIRGL